MLIISLLKSSIWSPPPPPQIEVCFLLHCEVKGIQKTRVMCTKTHIPQRGVAMQPTMSGKELFLQQIVLLGTYCLPNEPTVTNANYEDLSLNCLLGEDHY